MDHVSWFDPGEEIVGQTGTFSLSSTAIDQVLWTDCEVSQSRFTACTFTDCQFERVAFLDCDLSSVSFIDCVFKDCTVRGGKKAPFLAFVDSLINGMTITGLGAEALEIQGGRLRELTISECSLGRLTFSAVKKTPKHRQSVTITDTTLNAVGGITQLAEAGVEVQVDAALWTLFGDLLLRQIGIKQVT